MDYKGLLSLRTVFSELRNLMQAEHSKDVQKCLVQSQALVCHRKVSVFQFVCLKLMSF